QPLTLHRHDHGRALVALTNGQLKVDDKNGKVLETYSLKAGTAMGRGVDPPGQMHADVNDGPRPVQVIVVQLKNDRCNSTCTSTIAGTVARRANSTRRSLAE